jgi:ADP-dependent NAD(P)H-hydrate dehydratase / NAD(P)H-hydrate epimerase
MTEKWNNRLFMTRAQMREYDRIAIEDIGIPGPVLMENAGAGAARMAMDLLGEKRRLAVIAGPGNNGGDGFVIARHLLNAGYEVRTYMAQPASKLAGDALLNHGILHAMDAPIVEVSDPDKATGLVQMLREDGFVVDALLGTGVSRNVEGHLGDLIDMINDAAVPVLSVDIPSGLDADSGTAWGKVVRAVGTATFGHLKRGLVQHPGAGLAGRIRVVSIGVPGIVSDRAGWDGSMIDPESLRGLPGMRTEDSHKGTFGHLLLLAGSLGKTGAAVLCGRSAMRVGTGLVTIATTANAQPVIESKCLEVMVEALLDRTDAPITDKMVKRLGKLLEDKKAVVVGPGITTAPGVSALTMRLLQMMEVPAVVDADGINILAKDPTGAGRITAPMVFTPHPGEMARLVNKSVPAIQADRISVTREAARWHKVVIVLKGSRSVVATPDGRVFVNPTGNPGMASGGMGDVLSGIIGGFLAQGLEPLDAALLGTYIHGHAGDLAAQKLGQPALVASDLICELPSILREWSR